MSDKGTGVGLDAILDSIRAEVERTASLPSDLWKLAGASQSRRLGLLRLRTKDAAISIDIKDSYHASDFLQLPDRHFVLQAYRHILGRDPDKTGLEHFLGRLRRGILTKEEILGRLRYSDEGRGKGVIIKGLLPRFLLQTSFKIPVIGYFLRLAVGLAALPSFIRTVQSLDGRLQMETLTAHELLTLVEGKVNELVETTTVKADRNELRPLAHGIQDVSQTVQDLSQDVQDKRAELQALIDEHWHELQRRHQANRIDIRTLERIINSLPASGTRAVSPVPESGPGQVSAKGSTLKHVHDRLYVDFEDRFRGDRQAIKERLKVYLPAVREARSANADAPFLDLGCGRGEWLALLREENTVAQGVDLNSIMVEECRQAGLDVLEIDALGYLRGLPDASQAGVTGFHIVEHLETNVLIDFLDEVLRVLRPGGLAIFETPNPENILVGSCSFYVDPTHRNPLPPQTLAFLLEQRGFAGMEIRRLHPLEYAPYDDRDVLGQIAFRFNMEQDYAVLARKSS